MLAILVDDGRVTSGEQVASTLLVVAGNAVDAST